MNYTKTSLDAHIQRLSNMTSIINFYIPFYFSYNFHPFLYCIVFLPIFYWRKIDATSTKTLAYFSFKFIFLFCFCISSPPLKEIFPLPLPGESPIIIPTYTIWPGTRNERTSFMSILKPFLCAFLSRPKGKKNLRTLRSFFPKGWRSLGPATPVERDNVFCNW